MSPPRGTLVAVHVPKTAGTSLRGALTGAYGDGLREDYDDRPLTRPRGVRRAKALAHGLLHAGRTMDAACVYGHFLPVKYRWCREVRFALWVRDPVDRVLSRYAHYLRDVAAGDESHAARGLVPGLSLDGFLALTNYRDTLAEYLWGFPLERFEFIGSVADYEEDLRRFSRVFLDGRTLPVLHENVARTSAVTVPAWSEAQRTAVAEANPRDVALHRRALALRAHQVARGR